MATSITYWTDTEGRIYSSQPDAEAGDEQSTYHNDMFEMIGEGLTDVGELRLLSASEIMDRIKLNASTVAAYLGAL